jgi:hypothetical protein
MPHSHIPPCVQVGAGESDGEWEPGALLSALAAELAPGGGNGAQLGAVIFLCVGGAFHLVSPPFRRAFMHPPSQPHLSP